jgi:hypothetical protein
MITFQPPQIKRAPLARAVKDTSLASTKRAALWNILLMLSLRRLSNLFFMTSLLLMIPSFNDQLSVRSRRMDFQSPFETA